MRGTIVAVSIGALLASSPAAAVPGVDEPAKIEVSTLRKPLLRKYEAVVAGLDAFDKHHALAPAVPEPQFRIRLSSVAKTVLASPEQLRVRLEGDRDFILPLALGAGNLFTVPRSQAALDTKAELVLNQKRRDYRIEPHVRTPGLPANVRRLGDLRLECKVTMAIAKEEMPLLMVLAANSLFMSRDWCTIFTEDKTLFSVTTAEPLSRATLQEGERRQALKVKGNEFEVAIADVSWGDNALVTLEFGDPGTAPAAPQAAPALTGTAGGTPRTAP